MARLALALSVMLTLAAAVPAAAGEVQRPAGLDRYVPMKVPAGPGPAKYDRVFVKQLGPVAARNVLVLVPGTNGGAGGIVPVARDIVRRVPKTQVWIVDRREQALEDTSVFAERATRSACRTTTSASSTSGWRARRRSSPPTGSEASALGPAQRDPPGARRRAQGLPGRAFLGRLHRRGVRGLGLPRSSRLPRPRRARADRRRPAGELRLGRPARGRSASWPTSVPARCSSTCSARACPRSTASSPRSARSGPTSARTSLRFCSSTRCSRTSSSRAFRVTNEALFGYAFDETTSPDSLALIQIRAGQLADSGDPRGWQDGEITPIQRHARAYAADHPNATEWYYPRRLLLDFDAASPMRQTPAAKFLGLRLMHGR